MIKLRKAHCVRRAFLCGKGTLTGRCYEWMQERLATLQGTFCIDLCALH